MVIVEPGNPLSLTSDKSTEAYRNWWPGPDRAMTAFMNRSIDLIEGIARATDNRINLNRRGYVFATADAAQDPFPPDDGADGRGARRRRRRDFTTRRRAPTRPSPERGFDFPLTGADVITDTSLIRRHFPYLAPETVAVAHARRAGWLSAQQLGMVMLEAARARGVKIAERPGRRHRCRRRGCARCRSSATANARRSRRPMSCWPAGRCRSEMARLIGIELPIIAERHFKVSFPDTLERACRAPPRC